MDALHQQLARLVFLYWQVPPREGRELVRVLRKSPCARAVILRQQLTLLQTAYPTVQGWREADGWHVFTHVVTPAFMLHLLNDLRSTGSLTPAQVRVSEKAILEAVSAEGTWKAVDDAPMVR